MNRTKMRGRGGLEYDVLTQRRGERQKTRVKKGKWKRTGKKGRSSDQTKEHRVCHLWQAACCGLLYFLLRYRLVDPCDYMHSVLAAAFISVHLSVCPVSLPLPLPSLPICLAALQGHPASSGSDRASNQFLPVVTLQK